MKKQYWFLSLALLAALLVPPQGQAQFKGVSQKPQTSLTVLTVPWVPATPLSPHTTYPINTTTEATVVLGATVPSAVGSTDSYTVKWCFGDPSTDCTTFALVSPYSPYDISVTHQYPASAAAGTAWTAVVTVTDTTSGATGTANYYVTQAENNLASRVNVAIDSGLWYLHQTMWRNSTVVGSNTVQWGGWDTQTYACNSVNGEAYDCLYYGSINATNVQAFEVAGHYASGPNSSATDPYTDDVARGLARMFYFLQNQANAANVYEYNPAAVNYGCSSGYPESSNPASNGYCATGTTQIFYDPTSTACPSGSCSITYDGNSNGQMIYSNDGSGETIYTTGMFVDALVASGTPTALAPTGIAMGSGLPGIMGQTYQNIVQDMVDWYGACQYEYDYDIGNPGYSSYYRGGAFSASGGGWLYTCQQGDDNSTSQWAAIGLIGAQRGFNISVPQAIKDFNNVWVTNSQDVQDNPPTGSDPYASGDDYGSFGYRGSFYYSNGWGNFALTPSGMVQMALDGVGRTNNTAFGNPTNAPDQRFNNAETYYADNFCNSTSGGSTSAPRAYSYGMFSFTKSMLLHDPGGVLTPIQYLRTETPNVFTGDSEDPPDTIDWYAALSPSSVSLWPGGTKPVVYGTDPCDGVAQTLVSLQLAPPYGVSDGHWWGNDYDGYQYYYETGWSVIMLNKTVFVSCVNNLAGRGNPSGPGGAQVNLSWSAQTNATGYAVLRSSANGGPFSQVGTTNITAYRDGNDGLLPGSTYYYEVQPLQGTTEVCTSNKATVVIPPK